MGLSPTFFNIILEFGTINPATIKYAADEISPQTSIVLGSNCDFSTVTVFLSTLMFAPIYLSIISVWLREIYGSVNVVFPSTFNPASNMQDLTCAEASFET